MLHEKDRSVQAAFWMIVSCVALSFLAAMGRLLGNYMLIRSNCFLPTALLFLVMMPMVLHAINTVTNTT